MPPTTYPTLKEMLKQVFRQKANDPRQTLAMEKYAVGLRAQLSGRALQVPIPSTTKEKKTYVESQGEHQLYIATVCVCVCVSRGTKEVWEIPD
jgi:hypothetical protein